MKHRVGPLAAALPVETEPNFALLPAAARGGAASSKSSLASSSSESSHSLSESSAASASARLRAAALVRVGRGSEVFPSEDLASDLVSGDFAFDPTGFFVALELLVLLGRSDLFVPTSYLFFSTTVWPHRPRVRARVRGGVWQGRINGSALSCAQDRDAPHGVEKSRGDWAPTVCHPPGLAPFFRVRTGATTIL